MEGGTRRREEKKKPQGGRREGGYLNVSKMRTATTKVAKRCNRGAWDTPSSPCLSQSSSLLQDTLLTARIPNRVPSTIIQMLDGTGPPNGRSAVWTTPARMHQ